MTANPAALQPVIVEMQPPPSTTPLPTPTPTPPLPPPPPPTPAPSVAPTPSPTIAPAATLLPSVSPAATTTSPSPTPSPTPLSAPTSYPAVYPVVVGASALWTEGVRGRGVSVAVLDSGVAPDADLANRIIASVNFAAPRSAAHPGGHGTHVAGIGAGDGTRTARE